MSKPTELDYVTTPFAKPGDWAAGYHTGIDYRAAVGTEIFATKRGKVIHAGWGGYGEAYGIHIVVESWYKGKKIQHLYAHLSKVNVSEGSRVSRGEVLGLSGETGNTFGAHLHYEERVYPFGYYNHVLPVLINFRNKAKFNRKKKK